MSGPAVKRLPALALLVAAAVSAGQSAKTPLEKGKELFEDLCSSCHELARATSPRFATRAEWRQLVASMLVEGDAANDEEISLIADYLMKNFGAAASGARGAKITR